MILCLLKIKNKIYFEQFDTRAEMYDFIDVVAEKYGSMSIDYKKSIIINGSDVTIEEITTLIEDKYYLRIIGRTIDDEVYAELLELLGSLNLNITITYGIDPIEIYNASIHIDNTLTTTTNHLYGLYIYGFATSLVVSMGEMEGYDPEKSFIQQFENMDELVSVFEGLKHDFMELIDSEDVSSFTIRSNLKVIQNYIETKITMMTWKYTQPIKYLSGIYKRTNAPLAINTPVDTFMTSSEVIKKLRISDQTLSNWRRNGLVEFKKISNRKYLYMTESITNIFENGIDTTSINQLSENVPSGKHADYTTPAAVPKCIDYEYEILNMLKPMAFKIPEYKYKKQNFFLNFGNVCISSSPQVMINNQFQLVDFIKKNVITETPKELYEYLLLVRKNGKEPRLDTSRKMQPEFSKFYLNKLYDVTLVS